MNDGHQHPNHLARAVAKQLRKRNDSVPAQGILTDLFDALFYASLRTEEGEAIICDIVYLDPANPDPEPPPGPRCDRWMYVPLGEPIPLSTASLVKVARSSDPRSSSLVVYPSAEGQLFIWGLVDQAASFYEYINHDVNRGQYRPGLFHADIKGVGQLVVFVGTDKIAELKHDVLSGSTLDVLDGGVILNALSCGIRRHRDSIYEALYEEGFKHREVSPYGTYIVREWTFTLRRLLQRMLNFRHGGAILITGDEANRGLDVKYELHYGRLSTALANRSMAMIRTDRAFDQISEHYLDRDSNTVPTDLYLDEMINDSESQDADGELLGAIWFTSLLTRVDGLVLMNPDLEVRGFGAMITVEDRPVAMSSAGDIQASAARRRSVDYEHFGARHRSMMRYCAQVPGSVGFVVSQDGDVRAMTSLDSELIVFENITIQGYPASRARRRRPPTG